MVWKKNDIGSYERRTLLKTNVAMEGEVLGALLVTDVHQKKLHQMEDPWNLLIQKPSTCQRGHDVVIHQG